MKRRNTRGAKNRGKEREGRGVASLSFRCYRITSTKRQANGRGLRQSSSHEDAGISTVEDESKVTLGHSGLTDRTVGDKSESMSVEEVALGDDVTLEVRVTFQAIGTTTREDEGKISPALTSRSVVSFAVVGALPLARTP